MLKGFFVIINLLTNRILLKILQKKVLVKNCTKLLTINLISININMKISSH